MKLLKDKGKITKSYSFLSMLANFLIALSVSGLSVLGVISTELALPIVVVSAIILGVFGLAGRFIDQSIEGIGDDG